MRILWIALALLGASVGFASAQNQFATTTAGQSVSGFVPECLNGSGLAVPATSSGTCLGGTSDTASLVSGSLTTAGPAALSNFPITTTSGYGSVSVDITAIGTFNTILAQESINGGTNWFQVGLPMSTTGLYSFPNIGTQFRLYVSTNYGGTVTGDAVLRAADGVAGSFVRNVLLTSPTGNTGPAAIFNSGNQIGLGALTYYYSSPTEQSSNLASNIIANPYGNLRVDPENTTPSYISSFSVTPSTIGVFAQICGPSSGATRIRGFDIQGDASTAGLVTLVASKTSSASTGPTAVTPTPLDATNDSADSATVGYFSAPPTAGTLVGNLYQQLYYVPLAANVGAPVSKTFGAAPYDMQSIVLRSAAQCVQLATSGTLPTGASFIVNIYDTKE